MRVVASNGTSQLSNFEWSLIIKRIDLRNALSAAILIGGSILATSALAQRQVGSDSAMMGGHGAGWMGGGMWLAFLLAIVVAGLIAWFVAKKRK